MTSHNCDAEIRAIPYGWAMSGERQEGERWTCSCGREYMCVIDEAEGLYWVPIEQKGLAIAGEKLPKGTRVNLDSDGTVRRFYA